MAFRQCRHIKVNGLRCGSPAYRQGHFCYYHTNSRTVADQVKFGPLLLPAPDDPGAIQISVARINEAILSGRIEIRKANALFAGLKLAAQFIDRKQYFDFKRTVQTAETDTVGGELAPLNFVCDADEDCNECEYSDQCPRCIHPDEEEDGDSSEESHEEPEEDADEIFNQENEEEFGERREDGDEVSESHQPQAQGVREPALSAAQRLLRLDSR